MRCEWRTRWFAALAIGLVLSVSGLASAQPAQPAKDGDKATPAVSDQAVEDWVKVLSEKINDRSDVIRDSARAALIAVGQPALPTLKKMAAGDDAAAAEAARVLVSRIELSAPKEPVSTAMPVDTVIKQLILDDKQTPRVARIVEAHQKRASELSRRARESKMKGDDLNKAQDKLDQDLVKDLKGVLTPDQAKKLEANLKTRTQHKSNPPNKKSGGK